MRTIESAKSSLLLLLVFAAGCNLVRDDSRGHADTEAQDQQIELLMRQLEEMKTSSGPTSPRVLSVEVSVEERKPVDGHAEHLKSLIELQESPTGLNHALETYVDTNETIRNECRVVLKELEECRAQTNAPYSPQNSPDAGPAPAAE